ncbi:hypothetical protein JCM14076_29210 [Methylosoma difficile]
MSADIFISHSRSDNESALKIANTLEKMGLSVWIDQKEMTVGQPLKSLIDKALEQSNSIIALITPSFNESNYCQYELKMALEKGKRIFPVILNNTNPNNLPDSIRDLQAIKVDINSGDKDLKNLYELIDSKRSNWSKIREYLINELK